MAEASWALYESSRAGEPVLALVVRIDPSAGPAPRKGWLLTGKARDFPTFLETDRALLRAQVNGGLGWYNDHNAWWGHPEAFVAGSPLFPDPAGAGWASWGESLPRDGPPRRAAARLAPGLRLRQRDRRRRGLARPGPVAIGCAVRGRAGEGLRRVPRGPGREGRGAQRVLRPPDLAAQQGLPLLAVRGELQRGAVGRVLHRRAHGPRAGVPGQAALVEGHRSRRSSSTPRSTSSTTATRGTGA